MTKKVRIITNAVSDGATNLRDALIALGVNASKVRADSAPPRQLRPISIKWGSFALNADGLINVGNTQVVLNKNSGVDSLNKLKCFKALQKAGIPIPEFTETQLTAANWLASGERVYERHTLTGSAGDGIVVVEGTDSVVDRAPLYTKGMKGKRREYRIHVFNHDGIQRIFIQQKLRRQGFTENDGYSNTVRNLENGWIFAHDPNNIRTPRDVTIDAAVASIAALKLDFGAVDVIEMDKIADGSVVLEVNTAPGLQGATCYFYASCIAELANKE